TSVAAVSERCRGDNVFRAIRTVCPHELAQRACAAVCDFSFLTASLRSEISTEATSPAGTPPPAILQGYMFVQRRCGCQPYRNKRRYDSALPDHCADQPPSERQHLRRPRPSPPLVRVPAPATWLDTE